MRSDPIGLKTEKNLSGIRSDPNFFKNLKSEIRLDPIFILNMEIQNPIRSKILTVSKREIQSDPKMPTNLKSHIRTESENLKILKPLSLTHKECLFK